MHRAPTYAKYATTLSLLKVASSSSNRLKMASSYSALVMCVRVIFVCARAKWYCVLRNSPNAPLFRQEKTAHENTKKKTVSLIQKNVIVVENTRIRTLYSEANFRSQISVMYDKS